MKKLPYLLLTISLLTGIGAQAQQPISRKDYKEPERRNIIKLNVLSPALGTISIQHEHMIDNDHAIQLGLYYFTGDVFGEYFPIRGICFTPEYRIYLSQSGPRGFYAQPYARFARFWEVDRNTNSNPVNNTTSGSNNFYGVAGGMVFGRQWIMFNKISFDMYIGPLYTVCFFDDPTFTTRDLPPPMNGYWFRGGMTFGLLLN